eukprot:4964267-Prymnesium_polylepis.1
MVQTSDHIVVDATDPSAISITATHAADDAPALLAVHDSIEAAPEATMSVPLELEQASSKLPQAAAVVSATTSPLAPTVDEQKHATNPWSDHHWHHHQPASATAVRAESAMRMVLGDSEDLTKAPPLAVFGVLALGFAIGAVWMTLSRT